MNSVQKQSPILAPACIYHSVHAPIAYWILEVYVTIDAVVVSMRAMTMIGVK
jgi:hypothetical protein